MWTCSVCERTFKRKNQSHFCRTMNSVDEYIAQFSVEEQIKLNKLRTMIKNVAPDAEEQLRWGMPTYVQPGNIVHFAMHKKHIGLYVGASAVNAFADELAHLHCSKGTIQLSKTQPLPQTIIENIVLFNIEKHEEN